MPIAISNLPVAFNVESNNCIFDKRLFCQPVEQIDGLSFGWELDEDGGNVVQCSTFETENCAMVTTWAAAVHGWAYISPPPLHPNNGAIYIQGAGGGATITQTGIITQSGVWKVCLNIAAAPGGVFTGTINVQVADGVGTAVNIVPGETCFYINATVPGDLSIIPGIGAYLTLYEVTCVHICTDYTVYILGTDNTEYLQVTTNQTRINNQIFFQANWSDLLLNNGCYKFCIVNNCSGDGFELVVNGDFNSGSSGWSLGGGWSVGGGKASHASGSPGSISQTIDILPYTYYILKFTINAYVMGTCTPKVGGVSGTAAVANGSYSQIIFTGASPTDVLSFTASTTAIFGLDSVSLEIANYICSECFDLQDTHNCTKLLSWTNDDDAFNIPYSSIAFTNYLRVGALLEKSRYPQEVDRFAFSDGTRKILFGSSEKIRNLRFDILPEYLHDAIAIGKIHDHFYIDGEEYICSSDTYEPEWKENNGKVLRLAPSKIDVQKIVDLNKNKNC